MSRIRHDSPRSERVALAFHWLGFAASAATLVFGLGGVWWHWWAIRQHKDALAALETWESET